MAVEETQDTIYLVLPFSSPVGGEGGELSDAALESVAGGQDDSSLLLLSRPLPIYAQLLT